MSEERTAPSSRLRRGPARRYRYTGDGAQFIDGVPARDLTEEDVAVLTDDQKAAVRDSDLYASVDRDKEE